MAFPDSLTYIYPAQTFLQYGHMWEAVSVSPMLLRTPGYPFFLALVQLLTGNLTWAVAAVQNVLSLFLLIPVYLTARLLAGWRAARWAAGFCAISVLYFTLSFAVLTEILCVFLLAWFVYFTVRFLQQPRGRELLGAAVFLAAAVYVRPAAYYFMFAAAIMLVCFCAGKLIRFPVYKTALYFILPLLACIFPWHIRNAIQTGFSGFTSVGAYNSAYIEMVVAVFMALFAINFNLYFLLLIGRWREALKSEELHWYLALIAASVLAIALGIREQSGGMLNALRHAFFNVSSITSTTGFCTVDFVQWPHYCQWILVILMFCGACAGSTGGGLKTSRVVMVFKNITCEIRQMIHPRTVTRVQMDGKRVDEAGMRAVNTFFACFVVLLVLGTFLVSLDDHDTATNFTAVLSCLSNIGPGISLVGPTGNFNIFSYGSKIVLTFAMLIGRLEIYPILILFAPSTWKR